MMVWAVVLEAHAGCTTTIPGSSGGIYSDEDCDGIAGKIDQCDKPDKIGPDGILGLDTDGDGKWDACDNCPKLSNPEVFNIKTGQYWQPDSDADGVGDGCDNCPKNANADQQDGDGDGIGSECDCIFEEGNPLIPGSGDVCLSPTELDEYYCSYMVSGNVKVNCAQYSSATHDGVCETKACVLKPKPMPTNQPPPEPPCGSKDADKDGVFDKCDNCPFKSNPDQLDSDSDGIGDACDPALTGGGGGGGGGKAPYKWDDGGGGLTPNLCKKIPNNPSKSELTLGSMSTANLYAVARVLEGTTAVDFVAGEGGNILYRVVGKTGWMKLPHPFDAYPAALQWLYSDFQKDITAMWSSGNTIIATTVSGHVFRLTVTVSNPAQSSWQILGYGGAGDESPLGSPLYAVHGQSPDDFWVAGKNNAIWHFVNGSWQTAADDQMILKAIYSWESDRWYWGDPDIPTRITYSQPEVDFSELARTTWRGISTLSDGSLWVVGDGGKVIRRTAGGNGSWLNHSLTDDTNLRTVWATPDTLYIGGARGAIFCDPMNIHICHQLDSKITVLGIAGSAVDKLVAVGTHNLFLQKTGIGPSDWKPVLTEKVVSFKDPSFAANSVTAVTASAGIATAVGVNGAVYDLGAGGLKPTLIMRLQLSHPEWTETQWSAMTGVLDKKNKGMPVEGRLVGDDLSVASFKNSSSGYQWMLLHSDEEFVPFVGDYGTKHRNLRDYSMVGESLYAVGNVDFMLRGSPGKQWEKVSLKPPPPPVQDGFSFQAGDAGQVVYDPSVVPQFSAPLAMKTVRPGPNGTVLTAGSLGVIQYDPVAAALQYLLEGSTAVAQAFEKNAIWALSDGVHGGLTSTWTPSLTVEDNATIAKKIAVIGKEETVSYDPFGWWQTVPTWHLMIHESGAWTDMLGVPDNIGLHRLKPIDAKIFLFPSYPFHVQDFIVLGDDNFVAMSLFGLVQLNKTTIPHEFWMDGIYTYDSWADIGLTEATAYFDAYVLGAGSHNRLGLFGFKYQCTVGAEDAVSLALKYFGL